MKKDNAAFLEGAARKLFSSSAEFYWGGAKKEELPVPRGLEVAFAGRSNVGKSSLINAVVGRNGLARTSNTPGRTQELNFFDIAGIFSIVDMPGYGYAAASKKKISSWTSLMHSYLRGRASLARVFLLIDARHGLKDTDTPFLKIFSESAVSFQLVLTKVDEVAQSELKDKVDKIYSQIHKNPAAYPEILLTSVKKNMGILELRSSITKLLHERGVI